MEQPANNPDFVLSLARGLRVIEALHESGAARTISHLASDTGLSRAAIRRLLITLESLGYAEKVGTAYQLTNLISRLGATPRISAMAAPLLQQLSEAIHESCSLSVLDGSEIVYVARSAPKRVMTIDLNVGSRLPAYCTSMGRVLLAARTPEAIADYLAGAPFPELTPKTITSASQLRTALNGVRKRGYALVDEELELGLRSIAVPVATRSGRVVAAMNSGVSAARVLKRELLERILPALQECSARLGRMIE